MKKNLLLSMIVILGLLIFILSQNLEINLGRDIPEGAKGIWDDIPNKKNLGNNPGISKNLFYLGSGGFLSSNTVRNVQITLEYLFREGAINASPGAIDGLYGNLTATAHNMAVNRFGISGELSGSFAELKTAVLNSGLDGSSKFI